MKDTRIKIIGFAILMLLLSSINIALAYPEERANDIYLEIHIDDAKDFYLSNNDYFTFSFYPEISGWHIFQTYGPTDTVMEIYHKGESIVPQGARDGNEGGNDNELQNKYLEAGERYVVKVRLRSGGKDGQAILNIRAEEPTDKREDPLTLGYAKKVWLNYDRDIFTTQFTPIQSIPYIIESYSEDEDTVMDIFNPEGSSMITRGDTDDNNGVNSNELQVIKFEAGKTYTIQVHFKNLKIWGYVWVHVWKSTMNPLTYSQIFY